MKVLLATALVFLGLTAVAADNANDTVIKTNAQGFIDAWNKHDAKAMANFWATDGDVINPAGRVAKGHDAIEKLFSDEHSTGMKNTKAEMTVDNIKWIGNDIAMVDNTMTITGMTTPDGKTMPPTKMHVAAVMKKEGNDWKFSNVRPYAFMPMGPGMTKHGRTAKAEKTK